MRASNLGRVYRVADCAAARVSLEVSLDVGRGAGAGVQRSRHFSILGVLAGLFIGAVPVLAAVGWSVRAVSEPSVYRAKDAVECELEEKCDSYQILVQNIGDESSQGVVTLTDVLPAGTTTLRTPRRGAGPVEEEWECTGGAGHSKVVCELNEPVPAGHYAPYLDVIVSAPANEKPGVAKNEVTVESGSPEPASASSTLETPENGPPSVFSVNEFAFEAGSETGAPVLQAGGHPWELTTNLGTPAVQAPFGDAGPPEEKLGDDGPLFEAVKNIKRVVVELPLGFFGNTLAATKPENQCTQAQLHVGECPPESRVGTFAFSAGFFAHGEFSFTEDTNRSSNECCSAVYNMKPEAGYPAEFGFTFAKIPVYMYASVAHTSAGYRLRVVVPGVPQEIDLLHSELTFFGEPGQYNGSPSNETAFLTNPVDCAAGGLNARVEMTPWSEPEHAVYRETTAYTGLEGCDVLQFNPSLSFGPTPGGGKEPGTGEADEPSSFTGTVKVPQDEAFSGQATPELRTVTVTLPPGVTLNPPGGEGVVGCQAEGPEGINIGSSDIGPAGQDLGDPEATELGAGYEGGNGSRYDDGIYHTARGRCPAASAVGTVEATTPALTEPLTGHVYVAEPKCGGAGQNACTEASATNGELFGTYLELQNEKAGVIVKLAATLSANPATGQLTATFSENPQFPVSEVKLHLNGGARAPLANPQTCGTATTNALLEPWSGTPAAQSSSSFTVTGCAATMPFAPAFTATDSAPITAAGSGAFTVTLARQDREQDLAGLTVTLPPGLAAHFSQITPCEEPQAQAGDCPYTSKIGTATSGAGAGEDPLYLTGPVYLTGPYQGAPFGLTTVVPAKAGPFNLGNVIVRSKITVNPRTAQGIVTTPSLPQIVDGVPVRLRTVEVTINQPGFVANPTNCAPEQTTATITAAQGASETASSPLQATGCETLPFKPTFTESTKGKTSKTNGASLTVNLTQNPGEANIHKVNVQIPNALPSRLTTLQKACLESQFNANPAGCPAASDVGTATAVTPLLNKPLEGPAYLVARGTEFPDLEFVLQGEHITLILDGQTDIKKGITYSNFETVPDDPVTSFHAEFPEEPNSILAANVNLCAPTETITITKHVTRRIKGHRRHITIKVKKTIPKPLTSPTTITGQNGATIKQNTKITVTECPTTKPKPTPKKTKKKTKPHKK
jgi:hypothetical protein